MKKSLYVLVIIPLIIILVGCQIEVKNEKTQTTVLEQKIIQYDIETYSGSSNVGKISIQYPRLISTDRDYTAVNSLIHHEVNEWISKTVDIEVAGDLDYTVTFSDNVRLSVLFEGQITTESTAHPIQIARAVCVSLNNEAVIDPLDAIDINTEFIEEFREQMPESNDSDRFTDGQWQEVIDYIDDCTNEELQRLIESGEIVWIENGVLICVEVPHAIGDYVKISINNI